MYHPITFTPQDLITLILGICGAITCVSGAIAVIVKAVTAVDTFLGALLGISNAKYKKNM